MKSRRRKAIWIFTLSPDSFSSCQAEIVLVCLPDRHVLGCLNIFFYHVIWVGFFVFWGGGFTARRFHLLLYEASFLFSSCICFLSNLKPLLTENAKLNQCCSWGSSMQTRISIKNLCADIWSASQSTGNHDSEKGLVKKQFPTWTWYRS